MEMGDVVYVGVVISLIIYLIYVLFNPTEF